MNSSSAMPISVTLDSCSGSAISPQRLRADQRAADDVAERRAEPRLAEQGDEDQRGAEHDRAAVEDRGGGLRRSRPASSPRRLHRRKQGPERQQDRAMAGLPRRAPARAPRARPAAGSSCAAAEPAAQSTSARDDFVWVRPRPMPLDQRRRGLAEGTGVDLLRESLDPPLVIELDRGRDRGCRRSANAAPRAHLRGRARRIAAATPPAAGSRWYKAARSFPPPRSAARPILQDDALGLELVADAVGGGEVAVLLGFGALGDPRLDRRLRSRIALEPSDRSPIS